MSVLPQAGQTQSMTGARRGTGIGLVDRQEAGRDLEPRDHLGEGVTRQRGDYVDREARTGLDDETSVGIEDEGIAGSRGAGVAHDTESREDEPSAIENGGSGVHGG